MPRSEARLTLTQVFPDGGLFHTTWRPAAGSVSELQLHGLHPEAAERVDIGRYTNFELERLWGSEDVYCFSAVGKQDKADQRMFVLADVRGRPPQDSSSVELFIPIFERAFQEATRTLRLNLGVRDPRRELQWNRLVMHLQHEVDLDAATAQRLARELLSNTRHMGLEKTVVRLKLASRDTRSLSGDRVLGSGEQPLGHDLAQASPCAARTRDTL